MRKPLASGGSRVPGPSAKPASGAAAPQPPASLRLALHAGAVGTADHPPPFPVAPGELGAALGAGEPLDPGPGRALQARFGRDFSTVRIHDGAHADYVARALGANALAFGNQIAFRRGHYAPGTPRGDALLLHEAGHLAAGTGPGGTQSGSPVQLEVTVDDVTTEMVGMPFIVRSVQGTPPDQIPASARVVVTAWPTGFQATVRYTHGGRTITRDVPKLALRPDITSVAGMRRYSVGIASQQTAVEERGAAATAAWEALAELRVRRDEFRTHPEAFEAQSRVLEAEVARQEQLLQASQLALSRMLVRSTMYNRFDTVIVQWVNHYNTRFHPDTNLDPNMVKSMLFQESRMGTHGTHLERGPYSWAGGRQHPVRSRFNLGQAIDSYAHQQLLMIEEMAPAIYARHNLADLALANRRQGMTNQEMIEWNGGVLNTAMQEFFAQRDATGHNLMGSAGRDLHEDYGFWIRTAIRWLFLKYLSLRPPSWPEAVRAYNGSGARARQYRDEVLGRVGTRGVGDVPVGND